MKEGAAEFLAIVDEQDRRRCKSASDHGYRDAQFSMTNF
jgi:hypothetical protein